MSQAFHFSPRPNRAQEIRWREWSPQAFAEAQREDKPILLSLSAVWCHWCHVMDETTYSAPQVIERINQRFVPIRVDNDRRPDINARYNMGGWPTTAFLMPGGQTITGATYVPPAQMEQLLDRVADFYRENAADVRARLAEEPQRVLAAPPADAALSMEIVERVVEAVSDLYDPQYGGFGTAPKFPMTYALALLLDRWLRSREPRLEQMLAKTLHGMADGGMYDHVEGGWFRYSTDREWRIPHFEKMAEDHAALLPIYARFARASGDEGLKEHVAAALRWLLATLYDPGSGLFGGSQDADEEYYAKPLDERRAVRAPYVDRTTYANWCAGLAGALFEVAALTNDAATAAVGVRSLDALWERMHDGDRGLLYHFLEPGGTPQIWGLLTDQTAMLHALLDAHAATGEVRMLARAEQLADEMLATLASDRGGLMDRPPEGPSEGFLGIVDRPLVENAQAADALSRLAALADRPDLGERAQSILALHAAAYAKAGSFAAPYAQAVERALAPAPLVTVITDGGDSTALRRAALSLRLGEPLLDVRTLDARRDAERVARSGYPPLGDAVAYVCVGASCAPPIRAPGGVEAAFAAQLVARR